MAEQPNISQILAALGMQTFSKSEEYQLTEIVSVAQRPSNATPQNHPHGMVQMHHAQQMPPANPQMNSSQQPPHSNPYQQPYSQPYPPAQHLPAPIHSGSIDLSSVKPVNSGSLNLSDVRQRDSAAERNVHYNENPRNPATDYRRTGSSYRPSRSRSRSPSRYGRETFRDNYNPYRDDRRAESRPTASQLPRQRSYSPGIRGSQLGAYVPPSSSTDQIPHADKSALNHRSDDTSEIISIDSALVGLIIGRQGENLRRVEIDTKTRVQFVTPPDTGVSKRDCRITGPPEAREHAKAEIYRIIQESGKALGPAPARAQLPPDRNMGIGSRTAASHQPALRVGEDMTQMMVPNRTVGLIIGKGGETIRDLQLRSDCHVNILGEEKSVNGLRPVNLIGSIEAASIAKDLIMQIVESDAGGPVNLPALLRDGRADGRMLGPMENDKINDRIFVPSDAVGMIIGKGGETVKDMQNATGCKINVTPASGRDIEREIGLVGSRDAIEKAKNAINEKVRTVQEKNRSNSGMQRGQSSADRHSQKQQSLGSQGNQTQSGEPDPYAAYGGYQNYVALWYSSLQANQGQTDPQAQGPQGS